MTPEIPGPQSFESASLIPDYLVRFPQEFQILRIGGVYPGERNASVISPYSGEQESEYFGNVGEHCIAVARCAEIIAETILGKDNPQANEAVSRALIHDSTKRYEIMRRKAVERGFLSDAYSQKAYDTVESFLRDDQVPENIIDRIMHAGEETGHLSLPSFVEIKGGELSLKVQDNLPAMIAHLADDMTHTTQVEMGKPAESVFLTFEERMIASDFPHRYENLYKEGFGFDKQGNIVLVEDISEDRSDLAHVSPYIDWQIWIAEKIAAHLTSMITPVLQEGPQEYLKQLVNKSA